LARSRKPFCGSRRSLWLESAHGLPGRARDDTARHQAEALLGPPFSLEAPEHVAFVRQRGFVGFKRTAAVLRVKVRAALIDIVVGDEIRFSRLGHVSAANFPCKPSGAGKLERLVLRPDNALSSRLSVHLRRRGDFAVDLLLIQLRRPGAKAPKYENAEDKQKQR
jgi:hypothetical protein